MNLHLDRNAFNAAMQASSKKLNILPVFIEKDYWITLVLKRLSESRYNDNVVFKGGTSLSKGHKLINRFSEDIDIAIIHVPEMTGNKIKTLIRDVEKAVVSDLSEIPDSPVTSKGSRFRKSVYAYPKTGENRFYQGVSDNLIVEINAFANSSSYQKCDIDCFVGLFLTMNNQPELIRKYGLQPFSINVLDKKQTLVEKMVSLIRFSFGTNPVVNISEKIRHFYDLYFLYNDADCAAFLDSTLFVKTFYAVWSHDQNIFIEPEGWNTINPTESLLVKDFRPLWDRLKTTYSRELSLLAYGEIPPENKVAESFSEIMKKLFD
jgi:hypothetical protein